MEDFDSSLLIKLATKKTRLQKEGLEAIATGV